MADLVIPEGVVVGPDDALVVRAHPDSTPAEIAEFRARLKEALPDAKIVMVVAEQLAVVRKDGEQHG